MSKRAANVKKPSVQKPSVQKSGGQKPDFQETAPAAELRDITPAERGKVTRTFVWILVAFVAGIGIIVATLAVQGKAARDYGQQVLQAVQAGNPSENVSYGLKCVTALPGPLPRGILDCDVTVDRGKVGVILQAEGDKQYRLGEQ